MPWFNCQVCGYQAYVKPSHQKSGYGKYCSRKCRAESQKNGDKFKCSICHKELYRSIKGQRRSRSGTFFCSKSCQAVWRNLTYVGQNHANWKGGITTYRRTLQRSDTKSICAKCKSDDTRVLVAHHKDRNRKNNSLSNLIWLCHNCHYLVHHYKSESQNFVVPVA